MSKIRDLTEQRFGRLLVLSIAGRTQDGKVTWKCLCECGQEKTVSSRDLLRGHTKSCGCYQKERTSRANTLDLTGRRFGRLVVLRQVGIRQLGKAKKTRGVWQCQCDCGNIKNIVSNNLTSGYVKSCGCYNKEQRITHGMSHSLEYRNMKSREYIEKKIVLDKNWTIEMEIALKKLFSTCVICGRTNRLAVDHVYPLSRGYGLKPGNAVILCKSCNSRKHNKLPEKLPEDMRVPILKSAEEFKEYWETTHVQEI